MSAQRIADEITAGAETNAVRIVREAESRSELLLKKTQARVEDIQRDIDGLKLRKRDIEATLESSIQALRNTLISSASRTPATATRSTYRPRLAEPDAKAG